MSGLGGQWSCQRGVLAPRTTGFSFLLLCLWPVGIGQPCLFLLSKDMSGRAYFIGRAETFESPVTVLLPASQSSECTMLLGAVSEVPLFRRLYGLCWTDQ